MSLENRQRYLDRICRLVKRCYLEILKSSPGVFEEEGVFPAELTISTHLNSDRISSVYGFVKNRLESEIQNNLLFSDQSPFYCILSSSMEIREETERYNFKILPPRRRILTPIRYEKETTLILQKIPYLLKDYKQKQ